MRMNGENQDKKTEEIKQRLLDTLSKGTVQEIASYLKGIDPGLAGRLWTLGGDRSEEQFKFEVWSPLERNENVRDVLKADIYERIRHYIYKTGVLSAEILDAQEKKKWNANVSKWGLGGGIVALSFVAFAHMNNQAKIGVWMDGPDRDLTAQRLSIVEDFSKSCENHDVNSVYKKVERYMQERITAASSKNSLVIQANSSGDDVETCIMREAERHMDELQAEKAVLGGVGIPLSVLYLSAVFGLNIRKNRLNGELDRGLGRARKKQTSLNENLFKSLDQS